MTKTPIQGLIDDLTRRGVFLNPSKMTLLIKRSIDAYLEKEKQFGVDCFEAGFKNRHWVSAGDGDHAFNRFYEQYTQQQKQ